MLNSGSYNFSIVTENLEKFYFPLGVSSLVVSDKILSRKLKKVYPEIQIQGSCIAYIDTIEGLLEEEEFGVELHNPATWTIRNMDFLKKVHDYGIRQKQIMSEGCARKCQLELWHRKEATMGHYHGLEKTCRKSIPDIYTFLMGAWITIKQLKRIEDFIDVLKIPRNTFDNYSELYRFLRLYETEASYNILDFFGTPLSRIKKDNIIMSDVFDDAFFDNTVSDEINCNFLNQYVSKITNAPFFRET